MSLNSSVKFKHNRKTTTDTSIYTINRVTSMQESISNSLPCLFAVKFTIVCRFPLLLMIKIPIEISFYAVLETTTVLV